MEIIESLIVLKHYIRLLDEFSFRHIGRAITEEFLDTFAGRLEMKLQAHHPVPVHKSLMVTSLASRREDGSGGQIEGIAVPVKGEERPWQIFEKIAPWPRFNL